jgi:MFS family permease
MVVCLLVAAITVALAGMASSLEAVIALIAIAVFFMYLSGSTYWAIILGLVEPGRVGGVAGFVHLIANTAGIIAPIVTGVIVERTGSFVSAFVLAGGLATVGALLVAVLVRSSPIEHAPRPVALTRCAAPTLHRRTSSCKDGVRQPSQRGREPLEHDPESWNPVFPGGQTRNVSAEIMLKKEMSSWSRFRRDCQARLSRAYIIVALVIDLAAARGDVAG